ncbi:MAG: histidine--tRNA ligase family protein [Promethearchaeota archaeon]|nr:MAG: histidine--tRNA ligase family protein [Candidatus Lokiarchaeota archaeon]
MTDKESQKIIINRSAGFRDFYPEEFAKINFILETMKQVAREFGYVEYVTPAVELQKLYELKSGDDLVGETFKIKSRSGQKLVLIPELTPSLTRILAEKQQYYTKPIRWFSIPKCYRDETQQRGRVKEFWQLNIDLLGIDDIYADAEIIVILIDIITRCGLNENQFVVRINDRLFLQKFLDAIDIKDKLSIIQIFDKKDKLVQELIEKKLKSKFDESQAQDFALKIRQASNLDESIFNIIEKNTLTEKIVKNYDELRLKAFSSKLSKLGISADKIDILYKLSEIKDTPSEFIKRVKKLAPFDKIEEFLSDLSRLAEILENFGVTKYIIYDGSLARGLDYYTGIIFEAWSRDSILPRAIAGGGRYSDLVATLGGQPLPGTGFGMGETVLMELMDEYNIKYPKINITDVYIAPIKLKNLETIIQISDNLRSIGIKTTLNPFNWRIKRHFENAEKQGVKWMIIAGKKDLNQKSVTIRNIVSGEQELVPIKKVKNYLKRKLDK